MILVEPVSPNGFVLYKYHLPPLSTYLLPQNKCSRQSAGITEELISTSVFPRQNNISREAFCNAQGETSSTDNE
ncbi:unnamed protein product [Allacma fusca]|uniref:Uncharacterized protein n=1 Tax=Allacma fusca TaxID=39272 RepID=A0A8J2PTM3_9HEXA|nr:unnamed protein product [Allacma fusca]